MNHAFLPAPKPQAAPRVLRVLAVSALAFAALGLTGCSALNQFLPSSQPSRDANTGEVVEKQDNADVFSLRVGDCVDTDSSMSGEISGLPMIPCDQSHTDEVYFSYMVESEEFPGEDAIIAEAEQKCVPAFETFIGIGYQDSVLEYWPMYPTEGSWSDGDREVLCLAYDPAAATVGTLKGAAR